jgi:phosphoglycerol transferase MdoB-like AlkP superfamily enzyme
MADQNNSSTPPPLAPSFGHIFINIFTVVFIAFTVHRYLNFKFLAEAVPPESPIKSFLVGGLSDVWVAFLFTLAAASVSFYLRKLSKTSGIVTEIVFYAALVGTLAAHQGYVEFFRFQIEPFHIGYMTDVQFIGSNAASFLTRPNLTLTIIVGLTAGLMFFRREKILPPMTSRLLLLCLVLLALVAHNRNIRYRVQWFIPENLQTNVFESLYLRFKKLGNTEKLRKEDYVAAKQFYLPLSQSDDPYNATIFSYAFQDKAVTHPIASAIKQTFQTHIKAGRKPKIVVVMLESLRPSETGIFSAERTSLTPHMDQLAHTGIWFSKAFSTGSVTRGGQEAVFCGNFSGRNTSLMRNFDALAYTCITDSLGDDIAAKFWYHGGDGRFDGQEAFWQKHKVKDLMTVNEFSADVARTGWGVGDVSFFKKAAEKIIGLNQLSSTYAIGMVLSVTNHIPWHLPGDTEPPKNHLKPWFITTRYTDEGLGKFVGELKKGGAWDSALVFVVSDHGNKTEPYVDLYKNSRHKSQLQQSHINLIVSGGIAEAALYQENLASLSFDHYVSQTDISTTITDLIELRPFLTMGKNLFDQQSSYPVLSQTEEGIYIPTLDQLVSYSEVNKKLPDITSPEWPFRFHYKASLEYLLEMRSKR